MLVTIILPILAGRLSCELYVVLYIHLVLCNTPRHKPEKAFNGFLLSLGKIG